MFCMNFNRKICAKVDKKKQEIIIFKTFTLCLHDANLEYIITLDFNLESFYT
jgi:hypothetical protein